MRTHRKISLCIIIVGAFLLLTVFGCMASEITFSKGQLVYVPAYSHIYAGDREEPVLLAVTLSIRNTDIKRSMKIVYVDYYNTKGKLIKKYLEKPVTLKPLESIRFVVKQSDTAGGSGANFIVKWVSGRQMNVPVIESIMIGTQNQTDISFTSRGQAIK